MTFSWKHTKFHGKTALLLNKEPAIDLIQKMCKKYAINSNVGFKTPGFKYFKFLKTEDFEMIKSYPHLVTANYGINPIWILWLTMIDGVKMSLYINLVTKQVIWSKHRFSEKLYKTGTIFEGEIVGGIFRIWDLLYPNGKDTRSQFTKRNQGSNSNTNTNTSYNLHQRIDIIRSIMDQHYVSDSLIENLPIQLKTYVSYPYLKSFVETVLAKDNYNRGILFVPVDRSVKCFSALFHENHQIDRVPDHLNQLEDQDLIPHQIRVKEMPHPNQNEEGEDNEEEVMQEFWISPLDGFKDNYRMYSWTRTEMFDLGLVAIRSSQTSLMLLKAFKENEGVAKHGVRHLLNFKCQYLKKFRKWEPVEMVKN